MLYDFSAQYYNNWDSRKLDPTFYDIDSKKIYVRPDYDIANDPDGWIVHERIHAYLASIHFEDNYNPPLVVYPFNDVEKYAYTWQFVYLLETGRIESISDIKTFMPWKFYRYGEAWANDYFQRALIKVRNEDPKMPPAMIHGGGRLESNAELQLEEKFREIVDDAKRRILPILSSNVEQKKQTSVKQNDGYRKGCVTTLIATAILIIAIAVYYTL